MKTQNSLGNKTENTYHFSYATRTDKEILEGIKELNESVWCRLSPSKIHGVGVFALRDIPKGTPILKGVRASMYRFGTNPTYYITEKHVKLLHPAIWELITDRNPNPFYIGFNSPNADQCLMSFMNHSDNPNFGLSSTLIDINEGEELLEDYRNCGSCLNKVIHK